MTDHYLPGGSRVIGYVAQLEGTGHKFGSHQLHDECRCKPTVHRMNGRIEVWHNA